ncbi:unnamed protein product [Alopecurus aequalis]
MPSWDDEYSPPSMLGKCVAFGGSDTGRRFYMCSVPNEVENYGFVAWVDEEEWPPSLKNALGRLWGNYDAANSARIDEKILNAEMLKTVSDEKKRVEKDYNSLTADVNKYMDEAHKRVLKENYKKIMANTEEDVGEVHKEVEMYQAVEVLKKEIVELKNIQRSQADVMKAKEKTWIEENDALKEEKKKLEYMIFDLLKLKESNKEKFGRIKEICEE